MAAALFAFAASEAAAQAFPVYLPTRIDWIPEFPFSPSTVSATSTFYTAQRGQLGFTTFADQDPAAGPTDVPLPPQGFFLILPGETIQWSLAGTLSFDSSTFVVCAYADFATPGQPCNPLAPPIVPIATLAGPDFGSFSTSGGVYAFVPTGPVLIGTWEIHSDQGMIPEPATATLVGVAIAALGVLARRKRD